MQHDLWMSAAPVAGQQKHDSGTTSNTASKNPHVNTPTASQRVPPAVVCGLNGGHKVKVLSSFRQFSPNAEGCACNNTKIRATLLQQLQERNRRDPQTDDTNLALHWSFVLPNKHCTISQDVQLQLSWILEEIDNKSYSKRSLMRPLIDDLYIRTCRQFWSQRGRCISMPFQSFSHLWK